MSGKGQSDGFQVGATSGQQLPVSEYAKLVFREEFGGGIWGADAKPPGVLSECGG